MHHPEQARTGRFLKKCSIFWCFKSRRSTLSQKENASYSPKSHCSWRLVIIYSREELTQSFVTTSFDLIKSPHPHHVMNRAQIFRGEKRSMSEGRNGGLSDLPYTIFRSAQGQTLLRTPASLQAGGCSLGVELCRAELFWGQNQIQPLTFYLLFSQLLPEIQECIQTWEKDLQVCGLVCLFNSKYSFGEMNQ